MNGRTLIVIALLTSSFSQIAYSQNSSKATLVDEFSDSLCSDDLRGRIDLFFATISEKPGTIGKVSISRGPDLPGRILKIRRMMSNHVNFRNFDPARIRFEEDTGEPRVKFWLVADDATPDQPKSLAKGKYPAPTLFDSSRIFSVRKAEVEFGEESTEPCDFGLDLGQFADAVSGNDEYVAYLLATSSKQIDHSKALTALRLAAETLSKKHGLDSQRIKTKHVGKRSESEMQLWIVSKNEAAPALRPGTLP